MCSFLCACWQCLLNGVIEESVICLKKLHPSLSWSNVSVSFDNTWTLSLSDSRELNCTASPNTSKIKPFRKDFFDNKIYTLTVVPSSSISPSNLNACGGREKPKWPHTLEMLKVLPPGRQRTHPNVRMHQCEQSPAWSCVRRTLRNTRLPERQGSVSTKTNCGWPREATPTAKTPGMSFGVAVQNVGISLAPADWCSKKAQRSVLHPAWN